MHAAGPERVIYDTDPGIDDAIALYLALASPEIEVVALTSIFGNVDTDLATRNARILLDIAERGDIPVARGASTPLAMPFRGPAAVVHGANGLGDVEVPEPSAPPTDEPAHELLARLCREAPGQITILAVGPLTNLANALAYDPDIATNVGRVVIMGGNAYTAGNASPAAEANILSDPEAADVVFGAGWDVVMVGLDATNRAVMHDRHIEVLARSHRRTALFLAEIIPFYKAFHVEYGESDGILLHDPAAAAYLFAPELFTTVDAPIRVETESFSRGKTWPCARHAEYEMRPWDARPKVRICTGVDNERLADLVVERLR